MRNYSRKLRRNYKGGIWPLSTPQQDVDSAKANVEDANKKLAEAQAKLSAAPPEAQENVSMTDRIKQMSPFGGGAPIGKINKVTKSVKSVKSMVPKNPFKGKKQSKKNRRR
jgi:hypothetical protein